MVDVRLLCFAFSFLAGMFLGREAGGKYLVDVLGLVAHPPGLHNTAVMNITQMASMTVWRARVVVSAKLFEPSLKPLHYDGAINTFNFHSVN